MGDRWGTRRRAAVAPLLLAMLLGWLPQAAGAASPISLVVPDGTAFAALGHSCGGIQQQSVAFGFDPGSGYPTGAVYAQTRCGGSGRGGGYHTTTYSAWIGVEWDFTGAAISSTVLASPPSGIDPSLDTFDAHGNELSNVVNAINVPVSSCTVGNTTYCSYRAFLTLAPGYTPTPRLASLSVTIGPATGGTVVGLTGTGFTGATSVQFGAVAAAFTINSDISITATSPLSPAGLVDVTVTTSGGQSATSAADEFTFVAAPTVTGVAPDSGPVGGGTPVTITGTGFEGATIVAFGGVPAGFTVNSDSSISTVSPPGEAPGTVPVTVSGIGGKSALGANARFLYGVLSAGPPVVSRLSPAYGSASGGTAVIITGANFIGATAVHFGRTAAAAFHVVGAKTVVATAPPGVGIVDVSVTGPHGTSVTGPSDRFSYAPVVTGISPATGPSAGHTVVTISGHNLGHVSRVSFGGMPALSFTVNATGTAIKATTPPESGSGAKTVAVTVEGPGGTSATSPATNFTYAG